MIPSRHQESRSIAGIDNKRPAQGTGEPKILRKVVHAPVRWTRKLAAALWLGTCLTSAVLGADSSDLSCPTDSPLGGWIRMREVDHVRGSLGGCDQVVNIYMTFDLVNLGSLAAGMKASDPMLAKLPPQIREQMLNTRLSLIAAAGRSATKLKYKMWSDGCHDIGGELPCSLPAARASGEFVFDRYTSIGFQSTAPANLSPQSVVFNPMNPSLQISTASAGESFLYHTGYHCAADEGEKGEASNLSFYVNIQPIPVCRPGDSSAWEFACVPPTACFRTTDAGQRHQCAVNPGKFAVLPFEGTQDLHSPKENNPNYRGIVANKISWKICCGCGQAPPPDGSDSGGPLTGPPPSVPKPDKKNHNDCTGLQRGYDQEKGILDNIDAQRQALEDQYNNSLPKLSALYAKWEGLAPSVRTLILQNEANQIIKAFASLLADIAVEVLAPELGIAEAAEAPTALFEGAKQIGEMVETLQGATGTLEQMQEWAQSQGTGPDDPNVTNVLNLIGVTEQMQGLGTTMVGLKNRYDGMQDKRDAEAQKVANAKQALDNCLAGG